LFRGFLREKMMVERDVCFFTPLVTLVGLCRLIYCKFFVCNLLCLFGFVTGLVIVVVCCCLQVWLYPWGYAREGGTN
jgi:hypothetical protein